VPELLLGNQGMLKRFSIRKKLIVAFILIGVLPMLLTAYRGQDYIGGTGPPSLLR
jgi:hypothetical protein